MAGPGQRRVEFERQLDPPRVASRKSPIGPNSRETDLSIMLMNGNNASNTTIEVSVPTAVRSRVPT
jgi:hypothetical protein